MNDSVPPKRKRRWFQFRVRTLLIVVLVLGAFFGWLGSRLQSARKNRLAMAELQRVDNSLGFTLHYHLAEEPPDWLDRLLGDPGVFDVEKVSMGRATQADWELLHSLDGMLHSWDLDLNRGRGSNRHDFVTDAALTHLKGFSGLRNLDLGYTRITDAGLEHLKGLASLRYLRLDNTEVTSVGISNLQRALPNARIIPSPKQQAAIAEIKKAGVQVFLWYPRRLQITFPGPYLGNDADAVLAHVRELSNLTGRTDLSLGGAPISDIGLEHIKAVGNLTTLMLNDTEVTDVGLSHLAGLRTITSLHLAKTRITDAGLVYLKEMSGLSMLELGHTKVTDAGLEHLTGLSGLGYLFLGNTQVIDAGLVHLKGLTNLERLDLSNTQITDAGLEQLKGLSNLRTLGLSHAQVTNAGLEHLKGLTNLDTLWLANTHVTDEGVTKLQRALPNCKITH